MITVRKANAEDWEGITELWNSVILEDDYVASETVWDDGAQEKVYQMAELAKQEKAIYLVAESSGKIVGQLTVKRGKGRTSHTGSLGMVVAKEYRGKGVGSSLMEEAINEAKRIKLKLIELSCMATNNNALNLYKKFGFTELGTLPKGIKRKEEYIDLIHFYKEV